MFFNAWDWQINERLESRSLRQASKIIIDAEMNVEKIKEMVKKRTVWQNRILTLRRLILGCINVAFIGGFGYAIVWTNVNKYKIS